MENRTVLRLILSIIISLLILGPEMGLAYDDSLDHYEEHSTHQAINRYAIELFERDFLHDNGRDTYLKHARFDDERDVSGMDWHPKRHGKISDPTDRRTDLSGLGVKKFRDWIIHGGFSADQPELPMALLHFYDPTNKSIPWLTDKPFIAEFFTKLFGGTTVQNPEIDAVRWAFRTTDADTEPYYPYFQQKYGWIQAKEYFKKALENQDPHNQFYGQAWRSVGEVMHMVADMTLPAHVRNDGHAAGWPIKDADPYEHSTYGKDIEEKWDNFSWAANLNYFRFDAEQLMKDVAEYTNQNFFSKDTIPGNANRVGTHALPDISNMIDEDGYLVHTTTDGKKVIAAAPNYWYTMWIKRGVDTEKPWTIDQKVVIDQQWILIPTAVNACAGILYAFLPRFEITADISESEDYTGYYKVRGEAFLKQNIQWKNDIDINNGVYIVVKGQKGERRITVEKQSGKSLNSFVQEVVAEKGDEIWVEYDFGGYVVRSSTSKTALTITPDEIRDAKTGQPYSFTLKAENIPNDVKNVTFNWGFFGTGVPESNTKKDVSVGPDGKAHIQISHTFPAGAQGEVTLIAEIRDKATNNFLAEAEAKISFTDTEGYCPTQTVKWGGNHECYGTIQQAPLGTAEVFIKHKSSQIDEPGPYPDGQYNWGEFRCREYDARWIWVRGRCHPSYQ